MQCMGSPFRIWVKSLSKETFKNYQFHFPMLFMWLILALPFTEGIYTPILPSLMGWSGSIQQMLLITMAITFKQSACSLWSVLWPTVSCHTYFRFRQLCNHSFGRKQKNCKCSMSEVLLMSPTFLAYWLALTPANSCFAQAPLPLRLCA